MVWCSAEMGSYMAVYLQAAVQHFTGLCWETTGKRCLSSLPRAHGWRRQTGMMRHLYTLHPGDPYRTPKVRDICGIGWSF